MKKEELPQDDSALKKSGFGREMLYVKNSEGKYETDLSSGWEVKKEALDDAWDYIKEQTEEALQIVAKGEKSPIYYFMTKKIMDIQVLSGYTGFWSWTIKRHFKPSVFKKLSDAKLQKYAEAFEISVEELKKFKG